MIENVSNNSVKIGYTKGKAEDRKKQLLTGSSDDLRVIKTVPTKFGRKLESFLHQKFIRKKIRGEWFALDTEDIEQMDMICEKYEKNRQFLIDNDNYFMTYRENF